MNSPDTQSQKTTGFSLGTEEVKRRNILLKALMVGVGAGLVASAFRRALQLIEERRIDWMRGFDGRDAMIIGALLGALGGAVAVWLVRRFSPASAGSGIPHLKSVMLGDRRLRWRRVLPIKFLSGLIGIGSGLALGREGPTIQMGGATGLMMSEWFKVRPGEGERKALIGAGAGAGLAAAFNAPLAGVIFVVEELQGSFTPVVFVAAFLASVAADIVGRLLTGEMPVFTLPAMQAPGVNAVPVALVVGAIAGLTGVVFNRGVLATLDLYERFRRLPAPLLGGLCGVIIGIATCRNPETAGSGAVIVEQAISGDMTVRWLLILLGLRFMLTLLSYGSGATGGLFAPLLVIGALGGLATGDLANSIVPSLAPQPEVFAVIGMGAFLTAVVRAPLTGIILMVELTAQYRFMLPLLASCLVAYGIAEGLGDRPIYEALRERDLRRDPS